MSRKKQKKKNTVGDIILTVLLLIAVGVFCYAAFNLYNIYTEYKKGTDEYNQIQQMAVTEREPEEEKEDIVNIEKDDRLQAPLNVDFETLQGINSDVIGWIYVEALDDVSYPVVKGNDNETYLHTTYEGNYNFAGTIFIDYENAGDFSDCNTLVYGHNMKNGSMFGQLRNFVKDTEVYKKSKYFWILTPEKDYRYQIIAAYTTGVTSDTYTHFKGPGAEFEEYLERIEGYSEITVDPVETDMMDKVVTLSTCTGNDATRFVVQGVRVDEIAAQ